MDDMSRIWAEECMIDPEVTYLNCGTLAPTLKSVYQTVDAAYRSWMTKGPGAALGLPEADSYFDLMRATDRARHAVADWMGTNPQSIAITGNATDGVNLAFGSVKFKAGDRILTTNHEHEAVRYPLKRLADREHVDIDVVEFPDDGGEEALSAALSKALRPKTRMLALSSVSSRTGVALDMERVLSPLDLGGRLVLVDGAHAAGTQKTLLSPQMDFYVYPCHKWLFAPAGTGVLWVSERALRDTDGTLWGAPMINQSGERFENRDGAWRYEYGTRDWTKSIGIERAITFRRQWQESTIIDHYHALTEEFLSGLREACNIRTAGKGPLISLETMAASRIVQRLWEEHRILTKTSDTGMRLSLPPWLMTAHAHTLGRQIGTVIGQENHDT